MPNPAYVQGAEFSSASNPTTTGSASLTGTAAGNAILVLVYQYDNTVANNAPTDGTNTYTAIGGSGSSGTGSATNDLWSSYIATGIAGGNVTVTVTWGGSGTPTTAAHFFIVEISGASASTPVDAVTTGTGNSTSLTATLTCSSNNDLLIAYSIVDNNVTAVGSGFTQRIPGSGTDGDGNVLASKAGVASGSQTATMTQASGTTNNYVLFLIAIQGANASALEEVPGAMPLPGMPGAPLILAQEEFVRQPILALEEEIGWLPPAFAYAATYQAVFDEELAQPPPVVAALEEVAPPGPLFAMPTWWQSFVADEALPNMPFEEEPPPLLFTPAPGPAVVPTIFEEWVVFPSATFIEEWAPPAVIPVTTYGSSGAFLAEEALGIPFVGGNVTVDVIGVGHFIGLGHV